MKTLTEHERKQKRDKEKELRADLESRSTENLRGLLSHYKSDLDEIMFVINIIDAILKRRRFEEMNEKQTTLTDMMGE